MQASEVNEYILHYVQKDKTRMAIMLTGEWGSGKTYYIENELTHFLKNKNIAVVSVSLYGLDDVAMISKSIYMELRLHPLMRKYSEMTTTGVVVAKNIVKNIPVFHGIRWDISDRDLKKLYKAINLKDKLIILEDFERSNINIDNLLGYINGLVERDRAKVLIVANENEILKKKAGKNSEINQDNCDEGVHRYLQMKEKTISDTVEFNCEFKRAAQRIIKDFDNKILSGMFERKPEWIEEISRSIQYVCRKNLRTFIYAVQKTVDLIEKIDENEYEEDFFYCLLHGIICLSAKVKADEFPEWDEDKYLSMKLGAKNMPLMKFAYDYIRWQSFDSECVNQTYEEYKRFKIFERDIVYHDGDFKVLENFSIETEKNALGALRNVERRLQKIDEISVYSYSRLAYYMIYVGSIVEFAYTGACNIMISNIKEISKKGEIKIEELNFHIYDIEDEKLNQEYKEFVKRLSAAIEQENRRQKFSYNPDDIKTLYIDICKNEKKYIEGHSFLNKYDPYMIKEMLKSCTSEQIKEFRGILLVVYRNASKNQFDKKDVEMMKLLLGLIGEIYNEENEWDKIQVKQIKWLQENLEQFIRKME